jgi:hypothetical protein
MGADQVSWALDSSSSYTVNSMNAKVAQGASIAHFKDLWEAKLPLKVCIFT